MAERPAAAVDISRLLTGLRLARPSGVERMELGYAARLDGGAGEGVALTPLGPRVLTAAARRRVVATARSHWREDDRDDAAADAIIAFVQSGRRPAPSPPARRPRLLGLAPGLVRAALRRPAGALPKGGAYLHASFFRLERAAYFDWLARRPDISAAFVLYDMLPLQHPQMFRAGEEALHRARLETAARTGAMIITPAATVAEDLRTHYARTGFRTPPIHAGRLPVEDVFRPAAGPVPAGSRPFFLVCGTIEPRKNHRLLLAVWRTLVAELGEAAPVLVIAGRRGWRNEEVFAALDRLGPLERHVIEAPDLPTAALARLMQQAHGLLSPSFAEGYGLPVAEALACGTPALVADMPLYRELWSGTAQLIGPTDETAWANAIAALCRGRGTAQLNAPPAHAMRWPEHIEWIEGLLAAP